MGYGSGSDQAILLIIIFSSKKTFILMPQNTPVKFRRFPQFITPALFSNHLSRYRLEPKVFFVAATYALLLRVTLSDHFPARKWFTSCTYSSTHHLYTLAKSYIDLKPSKPLKRS
jgi:hypothetical protein